MDTKAFFHKFELDLMDEQAELNGAVPNYVPNFGHKTDAASAWGDIGTFLPFDPEKLEEAIERIKDLTVEL